MRRSLTLTAYDLLNRGARRLDIEPMEPALRAALLYVFGNAYSDIQRYEEAIAFGERALALQRALYGEVHSDVANSLFLLGSVHYTMGERALADSLLDIWAAMLPRVPQDDSPEQAERLGDLGILLNHCMDHVRAEGINRRASAMHVRTYGPRHGRTIGVANSLATSLQERGRLHEAEALLREQLTRLAPRDSSQEGGPTLRASVLRNLATVLSDQGRFSEAAPLFRQAIATQRDGGSPNVAATWTMFVRGGPP